jgi:hypothetical protein
MANDIQNARSPADHSEQGECQEELAQLYLRAFREFGIHALWNLRPVERPTVADALAITRQLRAEGNMAARRLAEKIEKLARAAH